MSIRIIPQDELEKSEKRATDMIPPLLFPRLKNLYNRRAERLRELAENNPLGDYLRFAALIAHAQEVVLPGVRLDASLKHGANWHDPGAALSALQPLRNRVACGSCKMQQLRAKP